MTTRHDHRRAFLRLLLAACVLPVRGFARQDKAKAAIDNAVSFDARTASYHVYPKGRIQDGLEAAARDPVNKTVYVHAGTYRPPAKGQALIWLNARHDGITLEAIGEVILTAGNAEIADARAPSYPAVVNHVVYFGDGVSRKTVFRGFKLTGANNFTTGSGEKSPIESDDIRKRRSSIRTAAASRFTRGPIPRLNTSKSTETTRVPAEAGFPLSTLDSRRIPCSFEIASSATTAPRPRDRPSISCTAVVQRLKTASSWETSPTWASTTSAC